MRLYLIYLFTSSVVIDFITDVTQASIKKTIAPVVMYVGTGKVVLTLKMYVARDWMLPAK